MADEKMNVHLDHPLDDDTPLDSIEDLPSFGAWPTGGYKVTMNIEDKTINNKRAIEVKFTHEETVELGEKGTLEISEPKPGDNCSTLYFRDNKVAMSNFNKEIGKAVAAKFKSTTLGQAMKDGNGTKVLVVLKREFNKDNNKNYMRVNALAFL